MDTVHLSKRVPAGNSDSMSSSDSGFLDNSHSAYDSVGSSSKAGSVSSDETEEKLFLDPTGIITEEMLEEEEKLRIRADKEIEKKRRELEAEAHNKEIEKKKIQRLQGLLQRSQFYSSFGQKKLDQLKEKERVKELRKKRNCRSADLENELVSAKVLKLDGSKSASQRILSENNAVNEVGEDTEKDGSVSKTSDSFESRITSLGITVPASQPKLLIGAALRDYQIQGLNWLKMLFLGGMNGILADEMGVGKTVQIISLICHLYEENVGGPFLIVAPLSTLPNWINEFEAFAPDIPVVLFHGNKIARRKLHSEIKKVHKILGHGSQPVVITSYEIPLMEKYFLRTVRWKYIIVDEGHRLKNHNTLLARTLSELKSINRMLLTGTPLQNNLYELWALLHFLMPEVFDDVDDLHAWFSADEIHQLGSHNTHGSLLEKEKNNNYISTLHKILEPFLLRRVKSDVNLNLPPKQEKHIFCPLSSTQYKLYSQAVDKTIVKLDERYKVEQLVIQDNADGTKAKRKRKSKLSFESYQMCLDNSSNDSFDFNFVEAPTSSLSPPKYPNDEEYIADEDFYKVRLTMTSVHAMLRKIANHPYLVRRLVHPGSNILKVDERLITSSGKMMVLDSLLERLKKNNHKVLIFSTYTTLLDLLEDYMEMKQYTYVRLDGSTKIETRKEYIRDFNTDPKIFAFLISTRAGGLGINLTAADTVVIFDSDWNPQVDLQAQDRCHRIGQTKPVIVFRLISSGTIDEKIVARADAKRKLEKVIIKAGAFKHSKSQKSKLYLEIESLKQLLEEKNHDFEIHPNGSVLTDEEWEKLLDRTVH